MAADLCQPECKRDAQNADLVAGNHRRSNSKKHQDEGAHKFRQVFLHDSSLVNCRLLFRARARNSGTPVLLRPAKPHFLLALCASLFGGNTETGCDDAPRSLSEARWLSQEKIRSRRTPSRRSIPPPLPDRRKPAAASIRDSSLFVLTFKRERRRAREDSIEAEKGALSAWSFGQERAHPPPFRPRIWRAHQRPGCRTPSCLRPPARPPRNRLLRRRPIGISRHYCPLAAGAAPSRPLMPTRSLISAQAWAAPCCSHPRIRFAPSSASNCIPPLPASARRNLALWRASSIPSRPCACTAATSPISLYPPVRASPSSSIPSRRRFCEACCAAGVALSPTGRGNSIFCMSTTSRRACWRASPGSPDYSVGHIRRSHADAVADRTILKRQPGAEYAATTLGGLLHLPLDGERQRLGSSQ